jgi:hypothetical protein
MAMTSLDRGLCQKLAIRSRHTFRGVQHLSLSVESLYSKFFSESSKMGRSELMIVASRAEASEMPSRFPQCCRCLTISRDLQRISPPSCLCW